MSNVLVFLSIISIVSCTNFTKNDARDADSIDANGFVEELVDSTLCEVEIVEYIDDDQYEKEDDSENALGNSGDQYIESVTIRSAPNTYPTPDYSYPQTSSGTFHSEEEIYDDYYNYKETSYCVEGVVVYEGDDDYYIVETRRGYTILEVYSGILYKGNKVRGELNRYGFKYLVNRNRKSEVRVYIEDYALDEDDALEWLGEHDHLDDYDQRKYDAYNE